MSEQIIHFGADPIRGVFWCVGGFRTQYGDGTSRGLPEKHFVRGKVMFFKEFQFWT